MIATELAVSDRWCDLQLELGNLNGLLATMSAIGSSEGDGPSSEDVMNMIRVLEDIVSPAYEELTAIMEEVAGEHRTPHHTGRRETMARAGRKDRGLLSKLDSAGKLMWYVRLYHEGKDRRFGSSPTKTSARDFYEKAKQEQKQGRFFPERYQHGGKELASAVIANYLTTLSSSGKKPTTIAVEQYYGQWWTACLEGNALHAVSPAILEQAMGDLAEARRPRKPFSMT